MDTSAGQEVERRIMKQKRINRYVVAAILFTIILLVLLPIYWTIVMALDAQTLDVMPNPPRFYPQELSLFNFEYAFEVVPLLQYFINTIFITVVNTFISIFFAMTAGYAFSKGNFRFKNFWFLFMLTVMMIPFEARMIPLFLQYQSYRMLDTYFPLVLGSFAYVYGMFLARQSIDKIPDSLREAAFIDGAREWTVFFRVIVPLSGPVIATLAILQVINNWNSFLWPLIVISSRDKQLISVGIAMFNSSVSAQYFGPKMAIALMGALPLIVMFLFLQKHIVSSLAFGGIKQ